MLHKWMDKALKCKENFVKLQKTEIMETEKKDGSRHYSRTKNSGIRAKGCQTIKCPQKKWWCKLPFNAPLRRS